MNEKQHPKKIRIFFAAFVIGILLISWLFIYLTRR